MKLKLTYICLITFLIVCSKAFSYDDRPIIVLREDDGRLNCRDSFPEFGNKSLLEFGKELNIPITWGVITEQTSNGTALSWTELIDYVTNTGGELASHSANHRAMNSLQEYIDDVMLSISAIESNTPFICNTFLQPGTWKNDAYIDTFAKLDNSLGQVIQGKFEQGFLYISGINCLGSRAYMHGTGADIGIDFNNQPVLDDLLKAIDYVSHIPGFIYIIQFHGIQSPTGSLVHNARSDVMAALMIRLNELRDDERIRLLSMNAAYSNQFSPDLNRVYDSGFEYYKPELQKYTQASMWQTISGSSIIQQLGYNNSCCGLLIPGSRLRENFSLPAGRYKLTWLQKPNSGTTLDKGITPLLSSFNNKGAQIFPVYSPKYLNTTNDWEQKSIILRIQENVGQMRFEYSSTGEYLIDNVSLKLENSIPDESVSGFKVTPVPTGMILSWRAPDNTLYSKINLRYSTSNKCPQTISEGTSIQQIDAENGNNQTLFYPYNWNGKADVYFSAFAVKDNAFSEPDVDYLAVDSNKPSVTINPINQQNNVVSISWKSTANKSGVFTSYYAIGSAPNATNIIGWTEDKDCLVQLDSLQSCANYYLSVKSQNLFSFWSDIVSLPFTTADLNIARVFEKQNGESVVATGVVSAIFKDCYYIESASRAKGIKVVGPSDSLSLGMPVTVQGTLKTDAGERYIEVQH